MFPPKDPRELVPVKMDFAALIPGQTIVSQTWEIAIKRGIDPAVASMLYGPPAIVGQACVHHLTAGVSGVDYIVYCTVTTDIGEKWTLGDVLQVQAVGV